MHFAWRTLATLVGAIILIAQASADRGASAEDMPDSAPSAAAPTVSAPEAAPHSSAPLAPRPRKVPKKPPARANAAPKKPAVAASPAALPPRAVPAPAPAPIPAPMPPGPAPGPVPASADAVAAPAAATPLSAGSVPQAPVPQAPGGAILGEAQSVVHARNAGITTCMDTIVAEAATVVDGAHTAMSGWNNKAPNDHLFESTIGLSYNSPTAPNGAAIIIAAPVGGNRCEGATVQVYPFALSCSQIQANLIKSGHTVATLKNVPLVQTDSGPRDMLLPTAGNGCVMVSLGQRSAPTP